MARGPVMNESRFEKIKEMLHINEKKQIGWTFSKIGEMNGCSGDTVSRVNRSEDFSGYRELLKQEGEHKKALREKRQRLRDDILNKAMMEARTNSGMPEQAETPPVDDQIDITLKKTLSEIRDAIDQVIFGLSRIRKATYMLPECVQTTFLSEIPKQGA